MCLTVYAKKKQGIIGKHRSNKPGPYRYSKGCYGYLPLESEIMPEMLPDETFIRVICIKILTLLQLSFFELPEKLKTRMWVDIRQQKL